MRPLLRDGAMLLAADPTALDAGPADAQGLFVADARALSRWRLAIAGFGLVEVGRETAADAVTVLQLPRHDRHDPESLLLRRRLAVTGDGLTEQLVLHSLTGADQRVQLRLELAADLVDQFSLRSTAGRDTALEVTSTGRAVAGSIEFGRASRRGELTWSARTVVAAEPAPARAEASPSSGGVPAAGVLEWDLLLPGHGRADLSLRARTTVEAGDAAAPPTDEERPVPPAPTADPATGTDPASVAFPATGTDPAPIAFPVIGAGAAPAQVPALRASALADLAALTVPCPGAPDLRVPAAGVPWFLTLFGRDALLTSLLARRPAPHLLPDVVEALRRTQGTVADARRQEQPGRIVHEVRRGELSMLDVVPYRRYYGTIDATALFLIGVGALAADDPRAAAGLEEASRAAIAWLRGPGRLDETGFVRFSADPRGLVQHGWKDSADAVTHRDGTPVTDDVALVEVQGYTVGAFRAAADLAAGPWRDDAWAVDLRRSADELAARVAQAFWMPAEQFPALALDAADRRVDRVTSNPGHLLWAGVLSADRAREVANRLLAPDLFTGFGLRTLSSAEPGYSPSAYHLGAVWPHDTALAMAGMQRYGLTAHARTLARGLLRAAAGCDGHLPEYLLGLDAADVPLPVRPPHSATPQAWAAAAALAAAEVLAPAG